MTPREWCLMEVAPLAGAWIETAAPAASPRGPWPSRPLRARGLKPDVRSHPEQRLTSRPLRARGLKHRQKVADSTEGGRAPCGRVD